MRSRAGKIFIVLISLSAWMPAQSNNYQVVDVSKGGTVRGTVTWSGALPKAMTFPVTKDAAVCDPDGAKRTDLQRLEVSAQGGVADTVVYLVDVHSGKAMPPATSVPVLNQRHCRYEPHITLVPQSAELKMKSSDATLHTVHMDGAATYNIPFPFPEQVSERPMNNAGVVNLRCNGGHVWMNAEIFVMEHPYYAVTDSSGRFELTGVPPGTYRIVAWHEGWHLNGEQSTFDVLTEQKVSRPTFTEPRTWNKSVTVAGNQTATVNFSIGEK